MKSNRASYVCGLFVAGAVLTLRAQSTWNYFISDAGGGNSLVTWNVRGDLAGSSGAAWTIPGTKSPTLVTMAINSPGIYTEVYATGGTLQPMPTPDGSYFQLDRSDVYVPILSYSTYHAPSSGNDSFGLSFWLDPGQAGIPLLYHPGTQSAVIALDFSDLNPGMYQSEMSSFYPAVTVTLTVGPVPEPSTLALFAAGGVGGGLLFRRRSSG